MNGTLSRALQRAAREGALPERVLNALHATDGQWALDPAERRWWATHDSYRSWLDTHDGEHPTASDVQAAGLRRWASRQEDQNLSRDQRTALRRLPGWARTSGDDRWGRARTVIGALLDAGVTLADPDIKPELLAEPTSSHEYALPDTAARRRHLLTVLTFAVQTGRLPEHLEPGARWEHHVADAVRVAAPAYVFEQPRLVVQAHLSRRAALRDLRSDRLPYDELALTKEDAWYRRHVALARRGLLVAADAAALLDE